jgi:hypothetical protein
MRKQFNRSQSAIPRTTQQSFLRVADHRHRGDPVVGESVVVKVRPSAASGLLLVAYLIAIPAATPTIWSGAHEAQSPKIAFALMGTLLTLWCVVVVRLVYAIWRQRRGHSTSGGFGWLAGLLLSATSVIVAPAVASTTSTTDASQSVHHHSKQASVLSVSAGVPMALMAKRRRDELKQLRIILEEGEVEEVITELHAVDDALIQRVLDALPPEDFGIIDIDNVTETGSVAASPDSPVLVVPIRNASKQWMLAFARPGGVITVNPGTDIQELASLATALHRDGRVVTTSSAIEAMRQLALRPSSRVMVMYLGTDPLDLEIANLCVRVTNRPTANEIGATRATTPGTRGHVELVTSQIFVRLLRPQVSVEGLFQPFNGDLRRRCIEMTSYLALHRHEAITGDRLRARVLGDGYTDASPRTLANTASAVRRSLGIYEGATRLAPVTPGGHYRTVDVSSDIERFHALVALARESANEEFVLLQEAIGLIEGEPLGAELRGFEWFLAEGHLARLQRDAEWAALRLAQLAVSAGDFDFAYYALERGRLVDPYSDDIVAALARVPRRRDHITLGDAGA